MTKTVVDNKKSKEGWLVKNYPGFFSTTSANILSSFVVAFLGGVILRLLIRTSIFVEFWLLIGILIAIVVFYFKHNNLKILFAIAVLCGLVTGVVRTDFEINKAINWIDMKYDGVGKIVKFAENKDDYQRVYLEIDGQRVNKNKQIIKQKEIVIAFAPIGINYEYGQVFNIKCNLTTPENKYEKFNYQRFLAGKKVYQICKSAKIEAMSTSVSNNKVIGRSKEKLYRLLHDMSMNIEHRLNKLFPMPESAYLAGLLLGGDNRLPEKVAEDFRRTGTTHTVAVSGYNITILAGVFMYLGILMGFWRGQAFWLAVCGIVIFIIMIGAPSSAVRAGITGVILLYAAQRGRLAGSVRIIALTAAIMVVSSPFIILYDAGFQLSFLATLGIILIYGPLSEKFKIENDFFGLKSIILVTIAAQLGVLGVLIYIFDSISLISLLANVIILPAIPIIMLGGVLAVIGSLISSSIGYLIALPVWFLLSLEIKSIELIAKIPWAMWEFEGVTIIFVIGYYALLAVVLLAIKNNSINN